MTLKKRLNQLGACDAAIQWVSERTLEQAWAECNRGDWMLWLYVRSKNIDQRKLTLTKAYCAETVKHLMKDERSLRALQAAFDFGNGLIEQDELAAYAAAAHAAAAAAYAAAAAAYAYAAAAYADAAAADAAAAAADAAAAYVAAKINNQKLTADICRQYLPFPQFD